MIYSNTVIRPHAFHREMRVAIAHALAGLSWRHHGIGVLQAYLTETDPEVRVHVWHPELVVVGEDRLVHDHRFDLRSMVLEGDVEHVEYITTPAAAGECQAHHVLHARLGDAALPTPEPEGRYNVVRVPMKIREGETYVFPARAFHLSRVHGLAVTLVTKLNQTDAPARILAPVGVVPVHGFAHTPTTETPKYLALAKAALLA